MSNYHCRADRRKNNSVISVIGTRLTLGYEILKWNNKSRECDSENKVEQTQVVWACRENEISRRDRTSVGLSRQSISDSRVRSRNNHEDPAEDICEEVDDSG